MCQGIAHAKMAGNQRRCWLEGGNTMAIPTPEAQLGGVAYSLGELYSALGIDRSEIVGDYRVIDLSKVVRGAVMRARALKSELSDAKLAADLAEAKADDLRKALDEAKAEIAAMLEDRRAEEERARMRLLERSKVLEGVALDPLAFPMARLVQLEAMGRYPTSKAMAAEEVRVLAQAYREALLADLDALVALGLRGEVVP